MSNGHITHYQILLLDSPHIKFSSATTLNPTTVLPETKEVPVSDCLDIMDHLQHSLLELIDHPLLESNATVSTIGSSYVCDGIRCARAAMVTEHEIIWAQALSQGTSTHRAELIALAQALCWEGGWKINIYTDSRYAFIMAHVHGDLYQERSLFTQSRLLAAILFLEKLAIIHCPGHQNGEIP